MRPAKSMAMPVCRDRLAALSAAMLMLPIVQVIASAVTRSSDIAQWW